MKRVFWRDGVGDVDAGQRIADLRQAVDPDVVVEVLERGEGALAVPFLGEARRLVHHVAQAEHEQLALLLQEVQRRLDLAAQAERLLVDEEDVGLEDPRRLQDDGRADRHQVLDRHAGAVRLVALVGDLHDAGHADEVDVRREAEGADDRRAGDHQDRQVVAIGDERLRDRAAAPEMPEPVGIVAVDQHARRTVRHGPLLARLGAAAENRHFFGSGASQRCVAKTSSGGESWPLSRGFGASFLHGRVPSLFAS